MEQLLYLPFCRYTSVSGIITCLSLQKKKPSLQGLLSRSYG